MLEPQKQPFPRVVVSMLNWNGKERTLAALESMLKLDYPNYEAIVVDNGSVDGSPQAIRQRFPQATVIENQTNLGYSRGCNVGISYAMQHEATYILIMNNDTRIDSAALTALVEAAERDPKIAFVTGKVYYMDDPQRIQKVGQLINMYTGIVKDIGGEVDQGQYDREQEFPIIDDVFWLCRVAAFRRIGTYDPTFFLLWEQADLCFRARKAGYRVVYTPRATLWHTGSATTGRGSPRNSYHLARNQIIFMKKHGTPLQQLSFLGHLLLLQTPLRVAGHLKHRRYKNIPAVLRGELAGLWWFARRTLGLART